MTDYSVRYRCQGPRSDSSRCNRRGRRTHWVPDLWLCWQHIRLYLDCVADYDTMLIFPPELLDS